MSEGKEEKVGIGKVSRDGFRTDFFKNYFSHLLILKLSTLQKSIKNRTR